MYYYMTYLNYQILLDFLQEIQEYNEHIWLISLIYVG
jgi:hypothetical protein